MIRLKSTIDGEWDPSASPFYLEVYGEVQPLVNSSFAEVLAPTAIGAGGDLGTPATTLPEPVYEYWWTLGYRRGHPSNKLTYRDWRAERHTAADVADDRTEPVLFDDPAAWVGLFFPTDVNWRVKEIAATLKFLTPINTKDHKWREVSAQIAKLSPLVADAGSLASLIPGGGAASAALNTVAKLQVGTVPQTTLDWTVEKTAHLGPSERLWQGVEWLLPKDTFDLLGGRVSGSVAVTFMEARRDGETEKADFLDGQMLAGAHIAIRSKPLLRVPQPAESNQNEGYLALPLRPRKDATVVPP